MYSNNNVVGLLLIILLLANSSASVAKDYGVRDSLMHLLDRPSTQATQRVDVLLDIAKSYVEEDRDKLFFYANQADSLSDLLDYSKGKARSLNLLGLYYFMQSDYSGAQQLLLEALDIAETLEGRGIISNTYLHLGNVLKEIGRHAESIEYILYALDLKVDLSDLKGVAKCYNLLGVNYRIQGDYPKALESAQNALKVKEELGDSVGISGVLNNIGTVYYFQNEYDKALEYYSYSLDICKNYGFKIGIVTSYNNIGIVHYRQGDIDRSLDFFLQSVEIQEEIDDRTGLAISYNNIAEIFLSKNDFEQAQSFYFKGMDMSQEIGYTSIEGWCSLGLGKVAQRKSKLEDAYSYALKAYSIGDATGEIELTQNSVELLSEVSAGLGLYKEAYEYMGLFKTMSDSMRNEASTREIVSLEYEYRIENERVEQEVREAEQLAKYQRQRLLTLIFVLSFSLMLILAVVVLRSYRRKQRDFRIISEQKQVIELKNSMLEQQKEEIRAQNESLHQRNEEVTTQNEQINLQKQQLQEQAIELQELDKVKSRFFTNISHEFRTPLTLIISPIEQLLQSIQGVHAKSTLTLALQNARILMGLINQLLSISRIEKGLVRIRLQQGIVKDEVAFIVEMFRLQVEAKGCVLAFTCSDANYNGFIDREKLRGILFNLLSNAIKNTNEGRIQVNLEPADTEGFVMITVSDTGKGIETDKLPYIFDRFYMANEAVGEVGSGIGLAFTKELVSVYKGDISVESTAGKGTTFTLQLPITNSVFPPDEVEFVEQDNYSEELSALGSEVLPMPADDYAGRAESKDAKKILLVEDHAELRQFIGANLVGNYQIIEAENGRMGIDIAIHKSPDLIVTDVMMPEVDGIELARTLKENEETSHIPIIMLTAKASEESKITGLQTQVDDYITKPFSIKELTVRISNILAIRERLRVKYQQSITVNPSEITTNSIDEQFIARILGVVEEYMADPEFSVEILCQKAGVSRSNLHTKLKSLLNQSATEFINTIRVKRAALLIQKKAGSISRIAYDVGFNNLSYFTKVFKNHFGYTPSQMDTGANE